MFFFQGVLLVNLTFQMTELHRNLLIPDCRNYWL